MRNSKENMWTMINEMQERRKEVSHVLVQKLILNNAKEIQIFRLSIKECHWVEVMEFYTHLFVYFGSNDDDWNF